MKYCGIQIILGPVYMKHFHFINVWGSESIYIGQRINTLDLQALGLQALGLKCLYDVFKVELRIQNSEHSFGINCPM